MRLKACGWIAWGLAVVSLISGQAAIGQMQVVGGGPATADFTHPDALYLRTGTVNLAPASSLLTAKTTLDIARRYVVHLDGPMTPSRRNELTEAGVVLGDYLPQNSYVCQMKAADGAALMALPYVRWLGAYDRAWRVDTDIGRIGYQTPERQALAAAGRVRLDIDLFAGATAGATIVGLNAAGGAVLHIADLGGRQRIVAEMPVDKVAALRDLDDIQFAQETDEPTPRDASANWITQSNITDSTPFWTVGLDGTGQIAGVIDWSLVPMHCCFSDGVNPIGALHRKIQGYYPTVPGSPGSFASHGNTVTSLLAGDAVGQVDLNYRGAAYKARIVFQDINQNIVGGGTTPNVMFDRLTIAHNDGARIHNNSWGSEANGNYSAWPYDVDRYSRANEDDLVLIAVSDGAVIKKPENAKNCLGVSAAGDGPSQDLQCTPSGTPLGGAGPTLDGRRKPDLMAVGCGMTAADYTLPCGLWSAGGGTSWAAPVASGHAIITRQYFLNGFYPTGSAVPGNAFNPSGALVKAILVNSSVDMSGLAGYPGLREGWGRILLNDALYLAGDARKTYVKDRRNASGLATGQADIVNITVLSSTQPLKVTLVWTDVEAAVNSVFTPVNNLDLTVTAPDASLYRGNNFASGESAAGGSADTLNNVEQVHRLAPVPGSYSIQVFGTAVNSGLQGYALVVSGAIIPFDCSTAIKGDINGDGQVNGLDVQEMSFVIAHFGGTIASAAECAADVGNSEAQCGPDGIVDASDLPGVIAITLTGQCDPPPFSCEGVVKGDINVDGQINGRDIQTYVQVLLSFTGSIDTAAKCAADIGSNGAPCTPDGQLSALDLSGFISLLLTGSCP